MKKKINTNDLNNLAKLKWACRRGMLELDVLLGNFLQEVYLDLSVADKQRFVDLLEYSDPELFSWLMGTAFPKDPEISSIVNRIRSHAHSRI